MAMSDGEVPPDLPRRDGAGPGQRDNCFPLRHMDGKQLAILLLVVSTNPCYLIVDLPKFVA